MKTKFWRFLWRIKQIVYALIIAGVTQTPLNIVAIYALPIALTSFLPIQEANAQQTLDPKGNINIFTSLDKTPNAEAYNKLKTRAQRDSIIDVRLQEDFTNTIHGRGPPQYPITWNCNQSMLQLSVNSHDWGKEVYRGGSDYLLYNGYDGENLDSIYTNQGTLKDEGKLGLPTYYLSLYDPITLSEGHAMDAIATGDTLTNFESWNIIEPQNDQTNVKPGDKRSPFPKNCKSVQIYYSYLFKTNKHEKNYYNWKMLEFEVVDGKAKLTYNVNDDTRMIYNGDNLDPKDPKWTIPLNERVHLITTRKELKDIDTGIEDKLIREEDIRAYPNPAGTFLKISLPRSTGEIQTKIYSIDGSLQQTRIGKQTLNIEPLKPGIYLIRVTDGNRDYNGKFMKK